MEVKQVIAGTLGVIFLTGTLVWAAPRDPRVNHRQVHQQQRIGQGVKNDSLTKGEVKRLEKGQLRIQREETRFKSDGTLTNKERAKLQHDQNVQSKSIYKQKHDNQNRK
ncbi:MAG: hypothetical protein HYU64_13185 [Armatimonadetes bacterium]|nr:hypothetical protein [Armatimonadota bacterium]